MTVQPLPTTEHRYDPRVCTLSLEAGEGFHCLTHCATVPVRDIEATHANLASTE